MTLTGCNNKGFCSPDGGLEAWGEFVGNEFITATDLGLAEFCVVRPERICTDCGRRLFAALISGFTAVFA